VNDFVVWLTALPLSRTIRAVSWVIPLLQTTHIVAIGMVLSAVIMIDLRIWGLSRSQTPAQLSQRFVPWIWAAMALLTVTGIALIAAAPPRRTPLLDPTFQVKMLLMVVAIAVTIILQLALRRDRAAAGGRVNGGILGIAAAAALVLWIAVTLAGRGRWIASIMPR
jgi:hypothetical protein